MHIQNNHVSFLAFNRIHSIGPRTVSLLWERWPNLSDIFNMPVGDLIDAGVAENLAHRIANFDSSVLAEDFTWQTKPNQHILTWANEDYPALLREIDSPPLVLYAKGNLSCLQTSTLAIVGTRRPTFTGSETAFRLAFELAESGITIVSGLALGIDAQAHLGCLKAKGRTVAILATGVDQVYPQRHLHIYEQIAESGLILSEFPLNSPPIAGHFPRRNRIISGLSLATLVIEAAIKSGSLITARLALEQNRDVFAVPGSIHSPQSRGCNYLLQQGAKLITSTHDILDELKFFSANTVEIKQNALASRNQDLVKCIGFETTTIDQMINRSGLDLSNVLHKLADLELTGAVKSVVGGYTRC